MNLSDEAIQKALNHQWQDAADLNCQILEADPQDIDALNRLAMAYTQLNKHHEAKDIYQKVLEIDPLNQIAKRNLIKLQSRCQNGESIIFTDLRASDFIEEPGKTKIVTLVQVAENAVLSDMHPCLQLEFSIRQKNICFYHQEKYIGRLPDDISRKLIFLYKRNNRYKVFVKAVAKSKITVFIRESKRSYQNRLYSSF